MSKDYEQEQYDKAGLGLIDWVGDCEERKISPPLVCTLLLDKAIDLCFHIMGTSKAMEAVDAMMREKIKDYETNPENN